MWKQLNCHDHEHMIEMYNVWIDEKRKEKQILTLSQMILRWNDILPLAKQSWLCNNNKQKKSLISMGKYNRPKRNRIFILVFI